MEKNPENLMKAMGHFEFFYMEQLRKKKKSINTFKEKWPKIPSYVKKDIKSLYYQDNLNELFDKNNKLDYLARRQRPKTTIHWGQLKLFLSTLQFLLYYAPRSQKVHVVYAGSAWGNNINVITKMFPQCYWYLIDPRRHYHLLYKNSKVLEIKKEYFTNETAMYYKNKLKGEFLSLIHI